MSILNKVIYFTDFVYLQSTELRSLENSLKKIRIWREYSMSESTSSEGRSIKFVGIILLDCS
jgi:hypothetical protein